jgi:1,5-anhydro-D-fructose reductase (1,5-anhydro-D-mannitol-forming)
VPDKLRFGLCGLGFMGRTYFAHLRQHPRACIAAICDQDPARRAGDWGGGVGNIGARGGERVDLSGIRAYADLAQLVMDPNVDAVAIALPTPLHADATVAALAAGKHVLCEKPMALTVPDCNRMLGAARRHNRTLMIGQCIRFWPQYEIIKRMVAEGALGPVRFAELKRLASPPGYSAGNWLMDGLQSGGALLDLHVHDIDFAQHLMGAPASLDAHGARGPSGHIDHIVATYGYPDGRYAIVQGGWVFQAPWPFEMAITVHGEKGTLVWSLNAGPDVLHYAGETEVRRIQPGDGTGWTHELDYFATCVLEGQPVSRCTPESSRNSIALAGLERRSIERKRRMVVPLAWRQS